MSLIGSKPNFSGILLLTRLAIISEVSSGSSQLRKKKSDLGSFFADLESSSGIIPWLISCAALIILLSDDCLNISLSLATGILLHMIISESTLPGPTEGN